MFINFVTQRNPVCKSTLMIDGVQYRTLALTATTVYLLELRYGWIITSLFVPNKNTNVLVTWRHKAPSYQQPWQWPGSPGYFGLSPGRIEHPIRTKCSGAHILLICTKIEQQVSRKRKSLVCIDEFQISDSFEFWYVRELLLRYRLIVMHHHAQNKKNTNALQCRHNGYDGVSNHQPHDWFTQPFIQVQIKENTKAPRHWPLWGEFLAQRASNAENVPFDDVIIEQHLAVVRCYKMTLLPRVWYEIW